MAGRSRGHIEGGEQEFTFRSVQLLKNETLGTGSYGAVCKAKCDQLICAAKLLHPVLFQKQVSDPGKEHRKPVHRFEQECRFLECINHPNIVQYLGTYCDSETNAPVLLMELMDESLTHFLESSPGDIPYHIQVNISKDIAQAIAFLHANGIIHRDLSSNNVLLIAGSRAKVTDFGMSKFTDLNAAQLATMTMCPGTLVFMSPEALDEPPVYTEKLDNFSLGVLFVQIATRQFPKPGDRFEIERIPNRRNPTCMIEAKVPIPEVERRQAHISLIESTHPLLPIALECLKDETVERPSSQQLCQSMDAIKREDWYLKSSKPLHKENEDTNLQLIEDLRCDNEMKERELQTSIEELQSLQHEVEAGEHQLRRLNQQLESNEEITATLQYTITQRDREIAELREAIATLQETITQRDRNIVEMHGILLAENETTTVQLSECIQDLRSEIDAKERVIETKEKDIQSLQPEVEAKENQVKRLSQQLESSEEITATLQEAITQKDKEIVKLREEKRFASGSAEVSRTSREAFNSIVWTTEHHLDVPTLLEPNCSAVVGNAVYFSWSRIVRVFNFLNKTWKELPKHPLDDFALVTVGKELTTVGGSTNWFGDDRDSNKLYAFVEGKWVAKYPPMTTKRSECASLYTDNTIIVAGGINSTKRLALTTVEILNIYNKHWSSVSSLPFTTSWPSMTICGECVYVHADREVVAKCSLLTLILSIPTSDDWESISALPVKCSTLVTIKGHLLAVGGVSTRGEPTKDVLQYNPTRDSWQVVSQTLIARSRTECSTALLPGNKLMVIGTRNYPPKEHPYELACFN